MHSDSSPGTGGDSGRVSQVTYDQQYPINALRNTALAAAEATLVMTLDADFVPSAGLHEDLRNAVRAHEGLEPRRPGNPLAACVDASLALADQFREGLALVVRAPQCCTTAVPLLHVPRTLDRPSSPAARRSSP